MKKVLQKIVEVVDLVALTCLMILLWACFSIYGLVTRDTSVFQKENL